jgi:hypothetical protein
MSDTNTTAAPPPPNGMIRFKVSVPARTDLPEKEVLAPDESTAWAKYRNLIGQSNLPFTPKVERVAT